MSVGLTKKFSLVLKLHHQTCKKFDVILAEPVTLTPYNTSLTPNLNSVTCVQPPPTLSKKIKKWGGGVAVYRLQQCSVAKMAKKILSRLLWDNSFIHLNFCYKCNSLFKDLSLVNLLSAKISFPRHVLINKLLVFWIICIQFGKLVWWRVNCPVIIQLQKKNIKFW